MIWENRDLLLFSTMGSSMFPFIRWNEKILIKRTLPEDIRIGDIVLFRSAENDKVCHRVIKIEDRNGVLWFRTKGDRSKKYDEPFNEEAMLGKVVAVNRRMKLIRLDTEEQRSFLNKFERFTARSIFIIKKILKKVVPLLQQSALYRATLGPILRKDIEFKMSNDETGYKFYASKNDQIIASAYLNYSKDNPHPGWWLWALRVEPLYRRLGIGKRLIKNIIEFAGQKGADTLYLNVCAENPSAPKFYEGLGFNIIAGSERTYERLRSTFVYMKKVL